MAGKKEGIIVAIGAGLLGLLWYLSSQSKPVHTCPTGFHKDPATGQCVADPVTCPPGYHYDSVTNSCVPDVVNTVKYISAIKDPNANATGFLPVILTAKDDAYMNWTYSLQAPSAYGAKTSSGGGVNGSHTLAEIFYFLPGSHTVTISVTDPAGTHNDSVSFTITPTLQFIPA